MLPKVSIITPSYNQAPYLEEAVLSVLNQDYPNIEYIIMDGGSTDGSVEIIQKYAGRLAYWTSEPDNGQSAAINEGLRHASGEIWAWMNADDLYLPGAVRQAVEWMQSNPEIDILYGDCTITDESSQSPAFYHAPEFNISEMVLGGVGIPSGSTFIRRRVFDSLGGFDESLHYLMDNDYWRRAMLDFKFRKLPATLSIYRVYSDAKTWDPDQSERRAQENIHMYIKLWERSDIPPNLRKLEARSMANAYYYAADLASQRKDKKLAFKYLLAGARFTPFRWSPAFFRNWMLILLPEKLSSNLRLIYRQIFRARVVPHENTDN